MIDELTITHSANGGWTTFEREARSGLEGRVKSLEHVTLDEPLVVRTLGRRLPAGLDRGTKRVRQMWAWGRSGAVESAVAGAEAALVVTHRRALRLATAPAHRRPNVLATIGDAVALQFEQMFGMPAGQARKLAELERRVFRRVDVAFFLSEWAADCARDQYADTGCRFVAFPPTMADPYPGGAPAREGSGRRLLFVGNDFRRKGGDLLLDAFEQQMIPGAELVIASSTRPPRHLPPSVTWRRSATRHEVLHELMPSCDVLVLPTRQDMSPWVIVEAMAAGLPVVATDRGAIRELVSDGETGRLVRDAAVAPVVEALRDVLDDTTFRDQASRRTRTIYEDRHSGDHGWTLLLDHLARAAGRSRPCASPSSTGRPAPGADTAPITLLLATTGDPKDPTTRSGVPSNLLKVLDTSDAVEVTATVDTALGPIAKAVAAPFSAFPNIRIWRSRMHHSRIATMVRTRRLNKAAEPHQFDVILAVRSTYFPLRHPYIPFCDSALTLTDPSGFAAGNRRWALRSARRREQRYFERAAHIFTAGNKLAESLTTAYGIPPSQVTTVGGGANYPPDPGPYEERESASILFVGRDFERKGGQDLLEAFGLVREAVPSATLTIVGTDLTPVPPGVTCLGAITDRERLRHLYRTASLLVLPSRWEPYGLVLLEAMAHALPCVATAVGTIPGIVEDGVSGLLVPPGAPRQLADAIITLLDDPDLSASMGAAGYELIVERMRWSHVVERMQAALRSVLRP